MTTQVDEKIKETVGPALGRVASGVHIVTVAHSDETGGNDGMLATWVIQASFNPPLLTVAVNSERAIYKSLKKGAEFGVNVLSKDNMDIFKSFAKPHTEGMDRFEGHELLDDIEGPPAFKKAVSYLKCTVKEVVEGGDHDIVIGEIKDGRLLNEGAEPMTHSRKNGFQY